MKPLPPRLPVGPCHTQPTEPSDQSGWRRCARHRVDPVATRWRQVRPSPEGVWEGESSVARLLNYSCARWRWAWWHSRALESSWRSVDVAHRRRQFSGCYCVSLILTLSVRYCTAASGRFSRTQGCKTPWRSVQFIAWSLVFARIRTEDWMIPVCLTCVSSQNTHTHWVGIKVWVLFRICMKNFVSFGSC